MFSSAIKKFISLGLWHLVWISIFVSVFLTEIITSIMSLIFHGEITYDYLITGVVAASFISAVVVSLIVIFIRRLKEAEKTLAEPSERHSALFQYNPDAVFTVDLLGEFVAANPAAIELSGYTKEEAMGLNFTRLLPDDQVKRVLGFYKKTLNGEPQHYQSALITRDGRRIEVDVTSVPAIVEGKVVGVYGVAKDITERKTAEEKLLLFRNLIDRAKDAIYLIDPKTSRFLDVNQEACEELGYKREELHGMGVIDIEVVLPDKFSWDKHVMKLRDLGSTTMEGVHKRKDKTTFPVEINIKFTSELDKEYIIASARNITKRNKAEQELRETNKIIQLIHEVGVALEETSTVEEAMATCLEKICSSTGWPVGHVYLNDSSGKLVPMNIWFMKDPKKFEAFRKVTRTTTFSPGEGLPGRVLQSGLPHWITDVTKDPNFPRAKLAENIGVKGAFAFPVLEEGKIGAVLEFFSAEIADPDEILLNTLTQLSTLFGGILERKRGIEEITKYSKKIETALYRAEDVLNIISKPPSLVPFFVTSQVYRLVRTIGGGDTIRWLDFKSEYAGIYIHDVSGHDIQEILLNILATSITDDHKANPRIKSISMPSLFLTDMNEHLCKFCNGTPQYITASYLLINFHMREIHLSLAGHPKPWLINTDGTAEQIGRYGLILGQFEISHESDNRYEDTTITLNSRQMLLLYSDGLMEQTNERGMPFERKFRERIVPRLEGLEPESAYEILKAEFEAHLDGKQPDDDVSFIFIGSRPEDRYETHEFVPSRQLINFLEDHRFRVGWRQTNAALNTNINSNDQAAEKCGARTINDISESYESITNKLLENGWSQKSIGHVKIALDEIIVNAITHGNLCSDRCIVTVTHILHRDILEVCVTDEGMGFGSFNIAQMFTEEDLLKESGRGLFMASKHASKMYFNEKGNKCWTIFSKS